jgi:peptidoglycan/xylan/chitin deacetylase (PgdA/CDA1 family)
MKAVLRTILFQFFLFIRKVIYVALGLLDTKLLKRKNMLFILSYHSISDDSWRFGVRFSTLRRQIYFLRKTHDFIALSEVNDYISGKKQLRKPGVVITFDDGYKDILQTKKFFKKLGIRPALFLLADTSRVNYSELATKRPFLNKKEVLSLVSSGWELGSHSDTHPNLADLAEKQVLEEVLGSKSRLESWLGLPIRFFAYPRGRYSDSVLRFVKKAKYELGLTMDDGFIGKRSNPFLLPRVGVDRTHTFAEFQFAFVPSVVLFRQLIKKSYLGRYL